MSSNNSIEVEIVVPAAVKVDDRERFEALMVEFLFGHDRVRPELEEPLKRRGVDLKRLASLSEGQSLGVCPTPGAHEFIPTPELARWGGRHGVDFTGGGRVYVTFDYEKGRATSGEDRTLRINLGLPPALEKLAQGDAVEVLGGVTRALFGDCDLSAPAQDYLRAFGIDLVDFAAQNAKLLDGGRMPATTRVRPAVAELLNASGFSVDRIGSIEVDAIRGLSGRVGALADADPWTKAIWSKATCC